MQNTHMQIYKPNKTKRKPTRHSLPVRSAYRSVHRACMFECAHSLYTTQHRTVIIIFSLILPQRRKLRQISIGVQLPFLFSSFFPPLPSLVPVLFPSPLPSFFPPLPSATAKGSERALKNLSSPSGSRRSPAAKRH